jgi:hypothetical protein
VYTVTLNPTFLSGFNGPTLAGKVSVTGTFWPKACITKTTIKPKRNLTLHMLLKNVRFEIHHMQSNTLVSFSGDGIGIGYFLIH